MTAQNRNFDEPLNCPECGAVNFGASEKCWLCGHILTIGAKTTFSPDRPPLSIDASHATDASRTYSLSTLFLLVTMAAVLCGITAVAPGLGIVLMILAVPALVRTFAYSAGQKNMGKRVMPYENLAMFLLSMGIVFLIIIAASIAFVAACFVSVIAPANQLGSAALGPAMIISGAVALFVAGFLFVKTWPKRNR